MNLKLKSIKTYLLQGQFDLEDTYEAIIDNKKFEKWKEDNDVDMTLEELLSTEEEINFKKTYYGGSIKFKLIENNVLVDNYDGSEKELLQETFEIL